MRVNPSSGLVQIRPDLYCYQDTYGEVQYRKLKTFDTPPNGEALPTDGLELKYYAVFCRANVENAKYIFSGIVSNRYRFEGHNVINEAIRSNLREKNIEILLERSFFTKTIVQLRTEFIIGNLTKTQGGDLFPTIISFNTYNGTGCQGISYGLSILENERFYSFSFNLGSMKSIHSIGSTFKVSTVLENYVTNFARNISELVSLNFNKPISEEAALASLDLVEAVSKKKRKEISAVLEEIKAKNNSQITCWQMFLAIAKCSSLMGNINTQRLLENVAERILELPHKMIESLKH